MTTEHPTLVALREIIEQHTQVFRCGLAPRSAVASMRDSARAAIPALEALLAERDELREERDELRAAARRVVAWNGRNDPLTFS